MWEEEGDVKAIDNVKDREMTRADLVLGLAVGKLQLLAMDAAKDCRTTHHVQAEFRED